MAEAARRPRRILVGGMVGSGSTFLYNVVREILTTDDPRTVATYSDEWSRKFEGPHHVAIKSHWGIRALVPPATRGVLLPVVSVRHPGDAVCSDMERFGFTFDFAVRRVALSLKFAGLLRRLEQTVLFRYEDRFTTGPRAATLLARVFGLKLDAATLAAISQRYDAAHIRDYADRLDAIPGLMRSADNPNDAWCPTTQIHRGHIGKQTSGRWRDLPLAERKAIDELCGEEATSFGYDCRA
jgi:hypothetical protein